MNDKQGNQRAVGGRKQDIATSAVGIADHMTAYPKVGVGYQRRLRTVWRICSIRYIEEHRPMRSSLQGAG
ncbi:MAG: hypothetical protein ABIU05_08810 [Nitrospirales bacterium]